jgi:hypothetical protein
MAAAIVRSRFLIGSLLIHLVLLLVIGTWVFIHGTRRHAHSAAFYWEGNEARKGVVVAPAAGCPAPPPSCRTEALKAPDIKLPPIVRIPNSTFTQLASHWVRAECPIAPVALPSAIELAGLPGKGGLGTRGEGFGLSGDGLGNGMGKGAGGHEVNFFGLKARAEKIVILVDASTSMLFPQKGGFDGYQRVKKEVIRVIQELPETGSFNLMLFCDSVYVFRSRELVPVTDESKQDATRWIEPLHQMDVRMAAAMMTTGAWAGPLLADFDSWRYTPNDPELATTGGTRVDIALLATFEQKPDAIFIISDGEPQIAGWSSSRVLQKTSQWKRDFYQKASIPMPCVHVVSYEADAHGEAFLRNLAGQNQGKFLRIKGFRNQRTAQLTGF